MDDVLVSVAEEAAVFTTDYWFVKYGAENAEAKMIEHFKEWPGFVEHVSEGSSERNAAGHIMENAFETFAWNNKVDPDELFKATQKLW